VIVLPASLAAAKSSPADREVKSTARGVLFLLSSGT